MLLISMIPFVPCKSNLSVTFVLVRKQTATIWSSSQNRLVFPAVFSNSSSIYIYIFYPYLKLIFTTLFFKPHLVKSGNEWSFLVTDASI